MGQAKSHLFADLKDPTNSEADPLSSINANSCASLRGRYEEVPSSKRTKPPAYLFRYQQFQIAEDTKPTEALNSHSARPPAKHPRCSSLHLVSAPSVSISCRPSGVPTSASAPPVKGVLRISPNTRKRFFHLSAEKIAHTP